MSPFVFRYILYGKTHLKSRVYASFGGFMQNNRSNLRIIFFFVHRNDLIRAPIHADKRIVERNVGVFAVKRFAIGHHLSDFFDPAVAEKRTAIVPGNASVNRLGRGGKAYGCITVRA